MSNDSLARSAIERTLVGLEDFVQEGCSARPEDKHHALQAIETVRSALSQSAFVDGDMETARLAWVRDLAKANLPYPGERGLEGFAAGWSDGFAAGSVPFARDCPTLPSSTREYDTVMQLAAISTACGQNTRESAKERIGRDNPYWTPAYEDACCAVDREMAQRERAEKAEAALSATRYSCFKSDGKCPDDKCDEAGRCLHPSI